MEITRLAPFPLTFVQSGFTPSTKYVVTIMNDYSADLVEIPVTSNVSGVISTPLPDYFSRYDAEYRVEIYEDESLTSTPVLGDVVWIDTLTIARPYVDPSTLVDTSTDIDEAKQYESLARSIIDSITGGFKYERDILEAVGNGADYIPCPVRLNKVIRVYENDILVYDAEPTDPAWVNLKEFKVSPDRTAITIALTGTGGYNRHQSRPIKVHSSASDSFEPYTGADDGSRHEPLMDRNYSFFPNGWDYVLVVDAGWAVIPNDIKQATTMLYNDLKCNNMPYLNSYIKEYESGQFTLKFDAGAFSKTGNNIVDQILSKYPRGIGRLGVV